MHLAEGLSKAMSQVFQKPLLCSTRRPASKPPHYHFPLLAPWACMLFCGVYFGFQGLPSLLAALPLLEGLLFVLTSFITNIHGAPMRPSTMYISEMEENFFPFWVLHFSEGCQKILLKLTLLITPRKSLPKSKRERKHFYY